jgi:hypothetical protein
MAGAYNGQEYFDYHQDYKSPNIIELTDEEQATLNRHMERPYDAKYIWSTFIRMDRIQQNKATDNIKMNVNNYLQYYENTGKKLEPLMYKAGEGVGPVPQPNTYEEWIQMFPYADKLREGWSYDVQETNNRSIQRALRQNGSGSRRSLQKSRLVKRKSRKYKSIKKSKKRSFRKRSGKY